MSLKCDNMDKLQETKVKSNTRYQRDMDRSFAVIYHNLRRIQDEGPKHDRHLTRRYSEPQISAPNAALLTSNNEAYGVHEETNSSNDLNPQTAKTRRVSFSNTVNRTSISEFQHALSDVEEVCKGGKTTLNQALLRVHRSYSDPQNLRAPNHGQILLKDKNTSGKVRSTTKLNDLTAKTFPQEGVDSPRNLNGKKQALEHEFKVADEEYYITEKE